MEKKSTKETILGYRNGFVYSKIGDVVYRADYADNSAKHFYCQYKELRKDIQKFGSLCDSTGKIIHSKRMKNYTVKLMSVYAEWEGIKARSKKDAIAQCDIPPECDLNNYFKFVAFEEN